jgi:hypothetical protein
MMLLTPFQFNDANYTVDRFGTIRDAVGQKVQGASSNLALELSEATAVAAAAGVPLPTTPAIVEPVYETVDELCSAQSS